MNKYLPLHKIEATNILVVGTMPEGFVLKVTILIKIKKGVLIRSWQFQPNIVDEESLLRRLKEEFGGRL